MGLHLLLVTPSKEYVPLMDELLESALSLTCLVAEMEVVHTKEDLFARAYGHVDDVILLDWELAQEDTPELVSQILTMNPQLRVVAMLPLNNRQYRQRVWDAGACNGIPKEHMDQEWLATVLCLMTRAIQREQKILTTQQAIL